MTDGRGDPADLTGELAAYPPGPDLLMVKTAVAGFATLSEPCGVTAVADACVGPWGLLGWLVGIETGRLTCVINTGVGSSTSSQWVPGQANYAAAIGRLERAMSRRNTTFRGFGVYMGPNDALSATPPWLSNVQSTLAGLRTRIGLTAAQSPAVISRLTVDVPTNVSYPGWAHVQSEIEAIADANHLLITPPTPALREAYNLHHTTAQNYAVAQSALAAAMSHGSWT
jgi:hypothetical protein